jgi:hypothetical protein
MYVAFPAPGSDSRRGRKPARGRSVGRVWEGQVPGFSDFENGTN